MSGFPSFFFLFFFKMFGNKMCRIWSKELETEGIWELYERVSSVFKKMFGKKMCQTLSKWLENEGIWAL